MYFNNDVNLTTPKVHFQWTCIKRTLTKRAYYNNEIEKQKGDPKRTWKTINQLIGKQKSNPAITEVKINDESITSPAGITETFNNHFVNVGSKLASENGDSTEHSFRDFKDFIQPASGVFA